MKLGLSNTVRSQVSGEWTPNNLSSLLHWYQMNTDVSTYTVVAAGNDVVTQWSDQKGSNHLIDNTTPAQTTTYNQAHPKLDGNGHIVFDHGNDELEFTSALSLGKFAIYIVAKFDDTFGDFVFEDAAGNNFLKVHTAADVRFRISGTRHDVVPGEELSADTFYVIGWEREDTAATTDDRLSIYVNNVALSQSGTGDGTEAITNTLDLTKMGDPANTMTVKEVVICDNSLETADRTQLYNYLTAL